MAIESGPLDATLAAAAGADPALLSDLRSAFMESVERQVDLLRRSRCDANWVMSATKLKSLAASFHADTLQGLAEQALDSAPGEPTIIREIEEYLGEIGGQ